MILHLLKILIDKAQNIFEWFLLADQPEPATCKNPTKTILLYCQVTKKYILVHSPYTRMIPRMKLFQLRLYLPMEHHHCRIFLLHLLDKIFHRDWLVAIPKDNWNLSMIPDCMHARQHVGDNLFKLVCNMAQERLLMSGESKLLNDRFHFDPFLNLDQ